MDFLYPILNVQKPFRMSHNEHFMHAYQIIAVTLTIILVDVYSVPTQWSKDNLNTVMLAPDLNYSQL